jgi:TolB-like protein/Tfp pilus assembly protein PilF
MTVLSNITEEKLLKQLDRILNSKSFDGVDRLKRFLTFIVAETLAGRGDQLKEFTVGEYVFDKKADFDPRSDPIVRVQAGRLRARLTRYHLEEGANDELIVELPKGRYVPVFRVREATPPKRSMTAVLLERNSVLVVPFESQSADPGLAFLCKRLTQDVTHAVTQVEGLIVSACGERGLAEILDHSVNGIQPFAAILIHGSVQQQGSKLRVACQLIEGTSGKYLWSTVVDRLADDDSFTLQEEIAQLIADKLREGFCEHGWKRRDEQNRKNLAAENLYLQGRYQLDQRTEESLLLAVGLFKKAIAEDSQFAKAHAGLADAYELLGHYGVLAPVEVWTKAPSSAGLAVLLDDDCAEAHIALAHVRSTQDWDWAGAEDEFRRALDLDPRNPTAHHWYAVSCLAPFGRLDEALDSMLIARALAPLSCIIACDCARVHYYRGEHEFALEQCDQAIELNPYFSQAYWMLGFIEEHHHEFEKAETAFNRALQLWPRSRRGKSGLARVHALMGKKEEGVRLLTELQQLSEICYVSPWELASIHFALGDEASGFEWLKRAFKDRSFELISIKVDPRFDRLKANPAFHELAGQLGLP